MAVKPEKIVRELLELVAALDRRVPRVERAGEIAIAREAAALKARALKRLAELEGKPARAASTRGTTSTRSELS